MRYADYDKIIITETDLEKYKRIFENDIENKKKELEEFINRAAKRIEWIKECENNNNYRILGSTYKNGRKKEILLIIKYPDGTQRDERYSFDKISEMRDKLNELKEKHNAVDWSKFRDELT